MSRKAIAFAAATATAIVLAAIAGPLPHQATARAASVGPVACREVTLPAALAPGQPAEYHVTGQLCATARELARPAAVQLLLHGFTYDASYWDFGTFGGQSYDYQAALAAAGWPSLAVSEIGTMRSSRPASTDVTITADAYVAHEMVQDLRDGDLGARWHHVIEVGHSFGSITAVREAATYHDVAGLVLTGYAHSDVAFHSVVEADQWPAAGDPKFAGDGLPAGYLTSRPGDRETMFDASGDVSPAVVARDEQTKDIGSLTLLETGLPDLTSTISRQASVPVLITNGEDDQLDCGPQVGGGVYSCASGTAIAGEEAPYWTAPLSACVVPGAGHDVTLAENSWMAVRDITAWLGGLRFRHVPAGCATAAG